MKSLTLKRNASVELLRLFGILMILGYHNIQVDLVIEGTYHFSIDYLTGFYSDCVPMFFMIMGFYLFQKTSYLQLIQKTIRKIILPTILLFAAYFYLYDWIINGQTLYDSIHHPLSDYLHMIKSLLTFQSPYSYTNHTWYLFLYVLIVLLFPAMDGLVKYLDQDVRREKIFLLSTLLLFMINDVFSNEFLAFSFHTTGGVFPAFIMVIWGHILYRHRNIFMHKWYAVLSQLGFFGANLIRTFIVYHRISPDGVWDTQIKAWYSSFGLICPTLLIIFAFNIIDGQKNTRPNHTICLLAKINLPMYLLHQICLDYLTSSGFRICSAAFAYSHFSETVGNYVVVAIDTFVSFILTLILVLLVLGVKNIILHTFNFLKPSARSDKSDHTH